LLIILDTALIAFIPSGLLIIIDTVIVALGPNSHCSFVDCECF
jgi:hypothetical protein